MEFEALFFLLGVVSLLGEVSPILAATYLALFRGRGIKGRWLFLVAGPMAVYSTIWVAMLIFIGPAFIILTFFTPAIMALEQQLPYWEPIYTWIGTYDFLLLPVICSVLSILLVMHAWPRWPSILAALSASTDART